MSSGSTGYSPAVPTTNGPSTWVPELGVEIWREVKSNGGTGDPPTRYERVYPLPESEE